MRQEKNTTQLVPRLRFPAFLEDGEWSAPKLANISMPIDDRVGDKTLIPVSISAGIGFVPQAEKFGRDISGNQYRHYTVIKNGDFVYNKGNSLKFPQGCVYDFLGEDPVAVPNVFICFRLKSGYSNSFFRYCFEHNIHGRQLRKHITSGARSNGLLNINKDIFFDVKIPTPRYEEQHHIAKYLSSLSELIAAESLKLSNLTIYRKSLLQSLFPPSGANIPPLRFPEFRKSKPWKLAPISDLLEKVSNPVNINATTVYREIGIRSHGKGIFHKSPITGAELGDKRVFWVEDNALAINIVFAWEQAIAVTSEREVGMIASHRFPMYRPKQEVDINFLKYFFLTKMGKELLEIASPGGAGRNKTLGQKDFEKLELLIPESTTEQNSIAKILSSVEHLIDLQNQRISSLKMKKTGMMQILFPTVNEVLA